MTIKHLTYCYVICYVNNETKFVLYMLGKYSVICYIYPNSMRMIKYNNRLEAHMDIKRRLALLEPKNNIEYTERGLEFIKGNIYLN